MNDYRESTEEIRLFLAQQYTQCMSLNQNQTFEEQKILKKLNITCPQRYDGYLCWPETPAGTIITQNCPDFIEGFNKNFVAHKTCNENGSWYKHPETLMEWSNYTNCIDLIDLQFRQMVNDLYIKGYSLSLTTLIISLCIFLGFRSLKCTRIRIHNHLFTSLALSCISWIVWYKIIIEVPENIRYYPKSCIGLHLLLQYLMLANYFWMFCEGLHLHLALVVVFVKDDIIMKWFIAIGWFAPIFFIISYATLRFYWSNDLVHCWMEESEVIWFLTVPVCISLAISFIFLVNVVCILIKKLNPTSTNPATLAVKKAVRATIILIPLFGLQHLLLPFRPEPKSSTEQYYQIVSAILVSLQGFCVSILFCFANHDVIYAIRLLLSHSFPKIKPSVTGSTNTGNLATLSRDIGV